MFNKLRTQIIIITVTITTAVLIVAGAMIMFFSSTMRPEPKPFLEITGISPLQSSQGNSEPPEYNDEELSIYIKQDREDGRKRLLLTLFGVGLSIEIIATVIAFYLSRKIVEPVQDAYEKQKIFIANASHELKTPLAVIQANMEALDVDKKNIKWKQNIENEITHANKLVLDLLQLARIDTGSKRKTSEQFDFTTELKRCTELYRAKFTGKITFHDKAKIQNFKLPRQDVMQVANILLDNATKYGNKFVSVTVDPHGFTVTNDGATIAKADCEKIFDRFYQIDKSREGSGLGLAIAKAVCEQNDWSIHCASDKNKVTFSVVFCKN